MVDVINAIAEPKEPRKYWNDLKRKLQQEGNETITNCDTFKLRTKDGKMYNTDMLDTEGIFRLIESVPSPKAEPFKMCLISLGKETKKLAISKDNALNYKYIDKNKRLDNNRTE